MQIAAQNIVQHREILRRLFVCLFVCLLRHVVLHAFVVAKLGRKEGESPFYLASWSDEYRMDSFLSVVTNKRKKNNMASTTCCNAADQVGDKNPAKV